MGAVFSERIRRVHSTPPGYNPSPFNSKKPLTRKETKMTGNSIDSLIPEWESNQRKKGQSYTAACETIKALTAQGKLEQMDAALCELLLSTAVDIDSIAPGDAASGRAAIRKTYLGILGKLYEVIDERERAANSLGNATPQERVAELLHIVS